MQRRAKMKRLKRTTSISSISSMSSMMFAFALSALVMTASPVYAMESANSVSAYGFASSPMMGDGEQETLIQKAAKLGYGQKVEKSVSDNNGELTVHNLLVEKNAVYADLSFRAKNTSDDIEARPRLNIQLNNEMNEQEQMTNYEYFTFTDAFSMYDQPAEFRSSGYSMQNDFNDKSLYKISVNSETSDDQIQTVYFNVDRIEFTQEITHTYTVSEWLKNPVEDIKVSIDYNENELFVNAESKNYVHFVVEKENDEKIWNNGGSSFGDDRGNVTTAYWDLTDNAFNPDTTKLTAMYTKQLDGARSDLSIKVPVNQDKIIDPIYSKEINKTITSAAGDLTITKIEATPLHITLSYEQDYAPDTDEPVRATPAPAPISLPNDLKSYKDTLTHAPAVQSYVRSEPEFKVLVDGEELYPSSGNFMIELGRKTKGSLVFNGLSIIESFSISVLQADGTYLEVSL